MGVGASGPGDSESTEEISPDSSTSWPKKEPEAVVGMSLVGCGFWEVMCVSRTMLVH